MVDLDEVKLVIDSKGTKEFNLCKKFYKEITGKNYNSSCSCSMNRCRQVLRNYYNENKLKKYE